MISLSNVLKSSAVRTGEPILLRDGMRDAARDRSESEQRVVWLRREQDIRMQARMERLHAKVQMMRTGEESGRMQGQKEAEQALAQAQARNRTQLAEAQRRQEEALRAADGDCRRQAETFARAMVEKIFGQRVELPEITPVEPEEARGSRPAAAEHRAQPHPVPVQAQAVPTEPPAPMEDLPSLDAEEIRRAAERAFPEEAPAPAVPFQDLPGLPARVLQNVLRNVRVHDLAVALKGMDAAGCAALLGALPRRAQETARQEMEFLGPVPMEDTAQAQARIGKIAGRLIRTGGLD